MSFNKVHGCDAFGKCSISLKEMNNSDDLYEQRINDKQVVNSRCYSKYPVDIIENFGFGFSLKTILKWIILILIVLVFIGYLVDKKPGFVSSPVVNIPIDTPSIMSDMAPQI